jgi:hypothetical protein
LTFLAQKPWIFTLFKKFKELPHAGQAEFKAHPLRVNDLHAIVKFVILINHVVFAVVFLRDSLMTHVGGVTSFGIHEGKVDI